MLNIVDLEKRWFIYKLKSYIPHLSIFISLIVIISIFLVFSRPSQDVSQATITSSVAPVIVKKEILPVKESPLDTPKPVVKTEPVQVLKQVPQVIHDNNRVKLSPSLGFMRKMQGSVQPYYKNDLEYKEQVQEQAPAPRTEVVEQEEVIVPTHTTEAEPKLKKISIKRQNTQNDIYEIIARFKKNNNPALSLFVAKKYYELGDYQQAYNYALITNKINKEIESSWIIFTKSLVKLGKRDKAIETLKKYIKQSHSSGARILLDEIYAGKFK